MGLQKVAFNFMVERGGKLAKSLLCTKPYKTLINSKSLKYSPLKTDLLDVSAERLSFENNFKSVIDAYEKATGKSMNYFGNINAQKAETLTNPEKIIALYCDDEYSTAVNLFLRYGKNNRYYDMYAGLYGLNDGIIPKYKEALKYALETVSEVKSYKGSTFRWQKGGLFSERFKDLKVGDIITDSSFVSTSASIQCCDTFRTKFNPLRIEPELIVIKSKNGKIIPKKLAGFRSYENEVLYNADTKYKYLGMKDIKSSDELGLTERIIELKGMRQPFMDFQPCKAIYLEEI